MSTRRRCRGVTLIELIVFIIVVSVGLVGIVSVFDLSVKSSGDPLQQKQMLAIAEAMMEEVMLKDYADTGGSCTSGTTPSCNPSSIADRPNYSAIDHYSGYNSQPASYALGDAPGSPSNPELASYTVTVGIDKGVAVGSVLAGQAAKITVTVAVGANALNLIGYRTNYGG